MTTAEKLRFIADRMEDGKEFVCKGTVYRWDNQEFMFTYTEQRYKGFCGHIALISDTDAFDFLLKPTLPELSADDIAFLKLAKDCGYGEWWIARDKDKTLALFKTKPKKMNNFWEFVSNPFADLPIHSPLLNIKWEDDDCYTVNQLLEAAK